MMKKTIAGFLTVGIIIGGAAAYAANATEINNYLKNGFSASAKESSKPVDDLAIPDGLSKEDNQVRQSVKKSMEIKGQGMNNPFGLDKNEVKSYLTTGSTTGLNTFEVLNDTSDKPALVVVKGGDDGFTGKALECFENSIKRLNQIDTTIVSTIRDKDGVVFIGADISGSKIFEEYPTYGSTYGKNESGNYVLINQSYYNKYQDNTDPAIEKIINIQCVSDLLTESRALYTSTNTSTNSFYLGETNSKGEYSIGGFTNAPDRLDDKVGIDKGMYMLNLSKNWFEQGKIDKVEKSFLDARGNSDLAYYSKN